MGPEKHAYDVMYDDQHYIVIADSFTEAVEKWRGWAQQAWGHEYVGDEEPQSVGLIFGIVID